MKVVQVVSHMMELHLVQLVWEIHDGIVQEFLSYEMFEVVEQVAED
jgi:hypothetical protein